MTFILDTDLDIKLTNENSWKLDLTRIYDSKHESDWRYDDVRALHTIYIYEKKLKPSDEKHECVETSYTTYCNIGEQIVQFLNDEKYDVIYKTQNDFEKDGRYVQKTNALGKALYDYREQVPDEDAYKEYKKDFDEKKKKPDYWNNLTFGNFILYYNFFYEGKPTRLLFDYKVKYTFLAVADWKKQIFPYYVFFSKKYYRRRLVKNRFNRDALINYFQFHKDKDQDANWRYLKRITDNVMHIYDEKDMPGFRVVDAFWRLLQCLNTYKDTFLKVDYNIQKMPEDMISVFYRCFNVIQMLGDSYNRSNEEIRSTAVILIKIFVHFCIKTKQNAETFWKALFGEKSLFQQNNAIVTEDFGIPDFNIFKDMTYWKKTEEKFPMTTKLWKKLDKNSPQIKFLKSFLERMLKWKTSSSFGFKTFGPPKAFLPPVDHTFKSLKF